jgi:hypothetical protein
MILNINNCRSGSGLVKRRKWLLLAAATVAEATHSFNPQMASFCELGSAESLAAA